jgi:catechol 2,3-dioxygenase-like lactoylglutathione lyase family enzyme
MTTPPSTSTSERRPVRVLGFNHVNLVVTDVGRSVTFYCDGLGLVVESDGGEITFLTTPGSGDLVALQQAGGPLDVASGRPRRPGDSGGVDHIGFDVAADDLDALVAAVIATGGGELMRFDDASGSPVAFVTDPDGYVIQLSVRPLRLAS